MSKSTLVECEEIAPVSSTLGNAQSDASTCQHSELHSTSQNEGAQSQDIEIGDRSHHAPQMTSGHDHQIISDNRRAAENICEPGGTQILGKGRATGNVCGRGAWQFIGFSSDDRTLNGLNSA